MTDLEREPKDVEKMTPMEKVEAVLALVLMIIIVYGMTLTVVGMTNG